MTLDELRVATAASYGMREGKWRADPYLVARLVEAEEAQTAGYGYSLTEWKPDNIPVSPRVLPTISQGVS